MTQCQDTKDAPICKDGYTYFKLPDMHQSDPKGHTLTEELLAFDYKPTSAAWDDHYVEYEETIEASVEEEEEEEDDVCLGCHLPEGLFTPGAARG